MATVTRPPFWVPRPSDDFVWQMPNKWMNAAIIQQLTAVKFYGRPGQVPTKRWLPYLTYDVAESQWPAAPVNSTIIEFLTKQKIYGSGGQVPTKRWAPYYTENDPPPWQRPPEWLNADALQVLGKLQPFKPKRWRLDYDDPPAWAPALDTLNANPNLVLAPPATAATMPRAPFWFPKAENGPDVFQGSRARNANLYPPIATYFSIPPVAWYSEDALWSGEPINSAAIQLLTAGGKVKPFRWNATIDDPPPWSGEPVNSATLHLLTNVNFPLFTPYLWRLQYTQNDPPMWQGAPTAPNVPLYLAKPFANRQTYWYSEDAFWQGAPLRSTTLSMLSTGQVKPFRWNYTLDDASPWQQPAQRNAPLNAPSGTPFTSRVPTWYAEDAFWSGAPARSLTLSMLMMPQVKPFRWNATLDDPPPWQQPKGFNQPLNTAAPVRFFVNPFTLQSYSDDQPWQQQPARSNIVSLLTVGGQVKPSRWNYGLDEPPVWQRQPVRSNTLLLLTIGGQVKPFRWSYGLDDPQVWVAAPISVNVNLNLQPAATPGAVDFYVNTPLDDPTWQPRLGGNPNLFSPTPPNPFSNRLRVWYAEDAVWTGRSGRSNTLSLLTVAGQVKPFRPNFTYDDASIWPAVPVPLNAFFRPLTTQFYGARGQVVPFRPNLTLDDPPNWQLQPARSNTLALLTVGGQVKQVRWNWGLDEPGPWLQPKGYNLTLNTAVPTATAGRWSYHYDDASTWQQPAARNTNLYGPVLSPLSNRLTVWYSEDAFWQGIPAAAPFAILHPPAAAPFTIRQPTWYSEDSAWTWTPPKSAILSMLARKPFNSRGPYWYSEDSFWAGSPLRSATLSMLTFRPKTVPWFSYWALEGYDVDAPGWVGAPRNAANTVNPIPPPPPPPTGRFEWIIRARYRGRR